jgi:hypothetical protein
VRVELVAKSLYTVVVSEPDATSKRRALGLTLILNLIMGALSSSADGEAPDWRVEVLHRPSSKVVLSWNVDGETAIGLKESLDRDLAALSPQAFADEWNVEPTSG